MFNKIPISQKLFKRCILFSSLSLSTIWNLHGNESDKFLGQQKFVYEAENYTATKFATIQTKMGEETIYMAPRNRSLPGDPLITTSWFELDNISVPEDGLYDIKLRYLYKQRFNSLRPMPIQINGEVVSRLSLKKMSLEDASKVDQESWREHIFQANLKEGDNSIRIDRLNKYDTPYFDKISVSRNIFVTNFELKGAPEIEVIEGESFQDPGFLIETHLDYDASSYVKVNSSSFDNTKPGSYIFTYTLEDFEGDDLCHLARKVKVSPKPIEQFEFDIVYEAEEFSEASLSQVKEKLGEKTVIIPERDSSLPGNPKVQSAYIEWDQIEVPHTSIYKLTLKYHYIHPRNLLHAMPITINGINQGILSQKKYNKNRVGEYQNTGWTYVDYFVPLNEGRNTLRISRNTHGSPWFDKIIITTPWDDLIKLEQDLETLLNHFSGVNPLEKEDIETMIKDFNTRLPLMSHANRDMVEKAFEIVSQYESIEGPWFLNDATKPTGGRGGYLNRNNGDVSDGANIHTIVFLTQQAIIDYIYKSTENFEKYRDLLDGYWFKSSEYFPGPVFDDPVNQVTVSIDGDNYYKDDYGHIYAYDKKEATRPTGAYLKPGSIVKVTFPDYVVNQGLLLRCGVHTLNTRNKPNFRRQDSVSITYPINKTEIEIANPMGGGLYVIVPMNTQLGLFDIKIENAVPSPIYSTQAFDRSSLEEWNSEVSKRGAPWADFKSDRFMIQVPSSWIYNVEDPENVLDKWDECLNIVADLLGHPHRTEKPYLWILQDVHIKGSAGSLGYPQQNRIYEARHAWDRYDGDFWGFTAGPVVNARMEWHEFGHALKMQKMPGEKETLIELLWPAIKDLAYDWNYQDPYDDNMTSVASFWMCYSSFLNQTHMAPIEMQYQKRGRARYIVTARNFGWDALGRYWSSIVEDRKNGLEVDTSHEGLLFRMSKEIGYDITPIFDFWGVKVADLDSLKEKIKSAGVGPSVKLYDMLLEYKESIPADLNEYKEAVRVWYNLKGNQQLKAPSKSLSKYDTHGEHYEYLTSYDETVSEEINAIVDEMILRHFPEGRPQD